MKSRRDSGDAQKGHAVAQHGRLFAKRCLVALSCGSDDAGVKRRIPPLRPVPQTQVQIEDGFWSERLKTNREVTIPFAIKRCEETGRIDNFAKAGGLMDGPFQGIYYDDSDVFKVIEGIAYSLATNPDPELDRYLDGLIAKIAAAQEPDGYLYTHRTIDPSSTAKAAGPVRWSNLKDSHELYNVGHLYEAAVAHFESTGKRALLDVATRNAELILATFGPGLRKDVPGHQEIEIGLVKLFRVTGDRRYLELAEFFLRERGNGNGHTLYGEYAQDHLPVLEQVEAVGHAVRALYMYCAMADVGSETHSDEYLDAIERLWQDIVCRKIALTGGVGARKSGEAFGAAYELPNATSYNETCAAIANVFLNHRLFLATGESRYLDVLERSLYNGLLAGVSLSGDRFFYVNPLSSDGATPFNYGGELTRAAWFKCSCCPVNLVRFFASLGQYVYSTDADDGIFVNLFIGGRATIRLRNAGQVTVTQETTFPWDGRTRIRIESANPHEVELHVRIPGWARGEPVPSDLYTYQSAREAADTVRIVLNGQSVRVPVVDGFAVIRRVWSRDDVLDVMLPMPVREVIAHPAVSDTAGKVALERGPLVYCVEAVDNDGDVPRLRRGEKINAVAMEDPILGKITRLVSEKGAGINAIPYYAWSHRAVGAMAVWLEAEKGSSQSI